MIIKLNYHVAPYAKFTLKCIKDFNVRPETIKYMEENTGTNFMDIGLRGVFIHLSPKAREIKAK